MIDDDKERLLKLIIDNGISVKVLLDIILSHDLNIMSLSEQIRVYLKEEHKLARLHKDLCMCIDTDLDFDKFKIIMNNYY